MCAKSDPFQNHRDRQHRQIAAGQLFVAGRNPPIPLEAIDRALDHRSLPVRVLVVRMIAHLVRAIRDDRVNVVGLEPLPELAGAVAFVAGDGVGPQPVPCLLQQRNRLWTLMALARGDRGDDRLAGPLRDQVDFAAISPTTAAKLGIGAPFLRAPAACWCARTLLPSIMVRLPSSVSS